MYIIVWMHVDLYLKVHMDTQVHQVSFSLNFSPPYLLNSVLPLLTCDILSESARSIQFQAVHLHNGMFTERSSEPIVFTGHSSGTYYCTACYRFSVYNWIRLYSYMIKRWQFILILIVHHHYLGVFKDVPISLPPWWFKKKEMGNSHSTGYPKR